MADCWTWPTIQKGRRNISRSGRAAAEVWGCFGNGHAQHSQLENGIMAAGKGREKLFNQQGIGKNN